MSEKVLILIIIIYFLFLFYFRRRIRSSRVVVKLSFNLRNLRKYWQYKRVNLKPARLIIKTIIIILLIGLGYTAYARMNPEKRFYRLIERCDDLIQEGKDEQAIIDMSNALKIRPDYVKGYYFLAHLYGEKSEMDKSEAAFWEVVKQEPGYENSVEMLVNLLIERKDIKGLQNLSQQIMEKMPVQSKVILAKSMIIGSMLEQAKTVLEECRMIAPKDPEIYQLLGDINAATDQSDAAMEYYQEALRLKFGLWQVHFNLAKLYLRKNMLDDAIWELNMARSLNRDFKIPGLTLARLYLNNNDFEKASETLNNILEDDCENHEASFILGSVYLRMGRFQEAINIFERLPREYRENESYSFNLALAYYNTGKYSKTIEWIDVLKELRGLDANDLRLLARAEYSLGRLGSSIETLRTLANEKDANSKDRELLARVQKQAQGIQLALAREKKKELEIVKSRYEDLENYLREKDYDSLIKGAQKAINENKQKAPFHNLLGVAYLAIRKPELAKRHFKLSYKEDKSNPMPLLNLVNILIKEGSIEEAENLLLEHNLRYEKEIRTRLILGKIYLVNREINKAETLFQNVISLEPKNHEAHQQIALIYRLKGDLKQALIEYEKAIDLNPNDVVSLNDAANIYANVKKEIKRSLDLASRAAKLSPKSGTILDTLGWIHYLSGDLEEALTSFEKAYEYNPYLPVIPFHIGLSQFHLKKYKEAEKNLKLALNMKGRLEEADEAKELLTRIEEFTRDLKKANTLKYN